MGHSSFHYHAIKNKNANHSIKKVQNLGNEIRSLYPNSLAKNQVCAIFHKRDIRKNVLLKFIKLCMETPCWCPFEGHKYGRRKPTETSVFDFSYKCVKSLLEKLIKIKVIFIVWIAKSQKIGNVFNPHNCFPGRQLCRVTQKRRN